MHFASSIHGIPNIQQDTSFSTQGDMNKTAENFNTKGNNKIHDGTREL